MILAFTTNIFDTALASLAYKDIKFLMVTLGTSHTSFGMVPSLIFMS
jgi:hypothetical protein